MKRLWFVALLGALISSAASVSGGGKPKVWRASGFRHRQGHHFTQSVL